MTTKARTSSLPLPAGWGVSQLVLHYEGEDLTRDPDPFAATVVVQLRMDVPPNSAPAEVAKSDEAILAAGLTGFERKSSGELAVGATKLVHLEHDLVDEDGRELRQLVLYFRRDRHLYMLTGTHRRGPRFEAVRPTILQIAASMA